MSDPTREAALTLYGIMDRQTVRTDGASRASVASIARYWSTEQFDNLDGESTVALRFCLERCAELLAAPSVDLEVVARIIDPVSFEKVRQHQQPGGPEVPSDAAWRCNRARDKAAFIAALFAGTAVLDRDDPAPVLGNDPHGAWRGRAPSGAPDVSDEVPGSATLTKAPAPEREGSR